MRGGETPGAYRAGPHVSFGSVPAMNAIVTGL
jgi:hypothetical protein